MGKSKTVECMIPCFTMEPILGFRKMLVFLTGDTIQRGDGVGKELVKREYIAIGSGGRPGVEMKVYVTTVCGQFGYDVVKQLCSRNHEPIGFRYTSELKQHT